MTNFDPAYGEPYPEDDGYGPPDHAAGYPLRRPRLWHVLTLGAGLTWALSALIGVGGKCDHLASRPAPTPNLSGITTTSVSPPSTVQEKPGYAGQYAQCAASGDVWDRIECGVELGVIYSPPELAQHSRAVAAAESASSSAVASANNAAAAQDRELEACMGKRGGTSGTLQLVALVLMGGAIIAGWRRARAYTQHKRDCALAADFARKFPEEHVELAPNDLLDAVVPAAYAASSEAFSQRVHWFGGDPQEDEERAYALKDLAAVANSERQRRLGGGWAPGMGADADLPEPKLPPQTTASAPAPTGSDWRAALASDSEDW